MESSIKRLRSSRKAVATTILAIPFDVVRAHILVHLDEFEVFALSKACKLWYEKIIDYRVQGFKKFVAVEYADQPTILKPFLAKIDFDSLIRYKQLLVENNDDVKIALAELRRVIAPTRSERMTDSMRKNRQRQREVRYRVHLENAAKSLKLLTTELAVRGYRHAIGLNTIESAPDVGVVFEHKVDGRSINAYSDKPKRNLHHRLTDGDVRLIQALTHETAIPTLLALKWVYPMDYDPSKVPQPTTGDAYLQLSCADINQL